MSLKTDYKDYELAPNMGGKKRYRMINNDDGTVSFVDVSEYLEIGDAFKGNDINTTNKNVNDLEASTLKLSEANGSVDYSTFMYVEGIQMLSMNNKITYDSPTNAGAFISAWRVEVGFNLIVRVDGVVVYDIPANTVGLCGLYLPLYKNQRLEILTNSPYDTWYAIVRVFKSITL